MLVQYARYINEGHNSLGSKQPMKCYRYGAKSHPKLYISCVAHSFLYFRELVVRVFPVGVVRIQIAPICMCECGDFVSHVMSYLCHVMPYLHHVMSYLHHVMSYLCHVT